jgi:hypothetical protein
MRRTVGVIARSLALISVALTARYGYKQADEEVDKWIAAILYGSIALSACAFDALAVKLWFKGAKKSSVFMGVAASLAFLVTLTNSLGGIASRADAVQAQRQAATDSREDNRRELKRLENALAGLHYVPTDEIAVAAAKRAADVSAANREIECEKRGPNCRQRELDDQEAARKLAEATSNKATTDRARSLETQIAAVKVKLDKPAAVGHANPLGAALANILGAAPDNLTSWQQAIVALAFEICLVGMMVGYTVLGEVAAVPEPPKPAEPEPAPARRPRLKVIDGKEPPPTLIKALTDLLEKAPRGRVAIDDLYLATKAKLEDTFAPTEFADNTGKFCRRVGIKTSVIEGKDYLMGVRLVTSMQQMASN